MNGPERGGGNLQLWYTKEGQSAIGTSSIYTVGKFDGLVLVVDTYGGKVGSARHFQGIGTNTCLGWQNPRVLERRIRRLSQPSCGRLSIVWSLRLFISEPGPPVSDTDQARSEHIRSESGWEAMSVQRQG